MAEVAKKRTVDVSRKGERSNHSGCSNSLAVSRRRCAPGLRGATWRGGALLSDVRRGGLVACVGVDDEDV